MKATRRIALASLVGACFLSVLPSARGDEGPRHLREAAIGTASRAEFFRHVLEIRLSVEDVARVTEGAADPLTGKKHLNVAPLVRDKVKAKAIELGTDPENIGLPTFTDDLARFKRDDKTYVGKMTIDFYLFRD